MAKWVFSLMILMTTQNASANSWTQDGCSLVTTQRITFESEASTFDSSVELNLFWSEQGLPEMIWSLREHAPAQLSVSWDKVQSSQNQRSFFIDEIRSDIQVFSQNRIPFEILSREATVVRFQNRTLSPKEWQWLIALFLTQKEMTVTVSSENGQSWIGQLSLDQSDSAYRQMAARCFASESEKYLASHGERKPQVPAPENLTTAAQGVSVGYGLVDASGLEKLLPSPLTFDSFTTPELAYAFLSKKRKMLNDFVSSAQDPLFVDATQEMALLFEEQTTLNTRLALLTSDNQTQDENLIQKSAEEKKRLETEIQALDEKIRIAKKSLQDLQQAELAAQEKLEPFLEPLADKDLLIEKQKQNVQQIKNYIRDIEALLASFKTQFKIPAEILSSEISSPWSLEEIEKQNREMDSQRRLYFALEKLEVELIQLQTEFKDLGDISDQISQLTTQFLSLTAQKSQIEQTIQAREAEIEKLQTLPYLADVSEIDFLTLLLTFEELQTTTKRSYEQEFAFHESQFEKLAQEHKRQKLALVKTAKWATFICDWPALIQSRLNSARLNCETIADLMNSANRTLFLEKLSPQLLDQAIEIQTKPWTQNVSKVDYLSQKMSEDLERLQNPVSQLLQLEAQLRVVIWRWNSQQATVSSVEVCQSAELSLALEQGQFDQTFYEKMHHCEKQKLFSLLKQNESDFQNSLLLSIDRGALQNQILEQQQNLTAESILFMNQVRGVLQASEDSAILQESLAQCLDITEGLSGCQKNFVAQEEFKSEFLTQVQTLSAHMASRTTLLKFDLQSAEKGVAELLKDQALFLQQNNLEQLIRQREQLIQSQRRKQNEMRDLERLARQKKVELDQQNQALLSLEQEATQTLSKLALLSIQISSLQSAWAEDCSGFQEIEKQIQALDEQILALPGASEALAGRKPAKATPALPLCLTESF